MEKPRIKLTNIFKHTALVARHRYCVFVYCCRAGIPWRGFVHDLSKFSPEEFFESVRWYQGNRSPIGVCRRQCGMSYAWLHHKGRNKHHLEYWLDGDCTEQPLMPYKYAVECICDKLAATRVYNGKNYNPEKLLNHWYKYGNRVGANPKTMKFLEAVFVEIAERGEKNVINKKRLREIYSSICTKE